MNFGGTIRLNRVGICVIIGVCVLFVLYMNTNGIENHKTEVRKNIESINLKKLLAAAITIAIRGGKEVVSIKKANDIGEKSKGNTKEGANDPVTKADYNSHCVMYYGISRSFSGLKIISEEHKEQSECTNISIIDNDLQKVFKTLQLDDQYVPIEDVTVWIDPLDATKEFTENLVQYVTTMVCIAVKGKPLIGVIHKPFEEPETYWAWKDRGNSENFGRKKADDADITKIIVSLSHAGTVKNVSEQAFGKNIEITSAAGAGYKSLEVAKRNVNAYVHITHIKKWDLCAGNAIIEALHGKMTTLSNTELDYSYNAKHLNEKGVLATMEKHDWYLEKLNSVKKNVVGLMLKILLFGLMIILNVGVWTCFVKALQRSSSLQATVSSTAVNYVFTALLGLLAFGETTSLQWWCGASLIVIGLVFISHSNKEHKQ